MTLAMQNEQMADSILPRFDWDDPRKRRYLSFRLMGFGREEAVKYAGIKSKTVYHWRDTDPQFEQLERTDLLTLRRQFAKSIFGLDFTRNLKLALERDFKVLQKALDHPQNLTKEEQDYLHKIRPLYTAREFQALEGFFNELGDIGSFDEMILVLRRQQSAQTTHPVQAPVIEAEYQESPDNQSWTTRREEEAEARPVLVAPDST